MKQSKNNQDSISKNRELLLRHRFRDYLQKLTLYRNPEDKLSLEAKLEQNVIKVTIDNLN